LHGWNGNRNEGDTAMPLAQVLVEHNYDVFMFDFRAHGESGGTRSSMGQFEIRDLAGAVEYLKARGVTSIGAIGWSLGGNTAINSAPEIPELRAIIANSVWAELVPLLESKLVRFTRVPILYTPAVTVAARLLYGIDIWNNRPARVLATLGDRPVLLVVDGQDPLVPLAEAHALQKAGAKNPNLELWVVPGAKHTRAYHDRPREFVERMLAFYDRYLQ
jgi:pimeloyl-ACP methyl ester carboxylesterase